MTIVERQNVAALLRFLFSFHLCPTSSGEFDMQVIARCANEGLVIDNDIVVTVLEIQSTFVRLGIETPKQAPFYREEILHIGDDGGNTLAGDGTQQSSDEPRVMVAAL
jgi:carbon storage regulator CsrA